MTVLKHFLWVLWCFHLFTSFGTSSDLYRCPKVRGGVMRAFREKCYRFVPNDKSWNGAQYDCQRTGGNLVHIKDRATQNFIYNTVKKDLGWRVNGMWIGAHDRTRSNNYEWVNDDRNRKGTPVTWSFWADGQPSCGFWGCTEFCGQMRLNDGGKWHDYRCGPTISSYHYCCMYDMGPKTTTTTTSPSTTRVSTTTLMKSTTSLTTKTLTTVMETTTKATTTKATTMESGKTTTEATTTPEATATMERNTKPKNFVTGQETKASVNAGESLKGEKDNTSVSVEPLAGWIIAGVMVFLLLLVFISVFRRRRCANTENPTSNIHFTNNRSGGESQPAATSPAAAHISLTFGPSNSSPEVEMAHGKDREQNELNGACAKADGEWRESTNLYDTITYEEDFEKAKTVALPITEYLNAKTLRRQDNGSFHALRDPGSLDGLHRPRSTEVNEYCNTNFPMGISAWSDAQSDINQPTLGFCGKQLDGYLSPSQIARPLSGVSSTESVKFPDSVIVMPQASGNDSTATVAPSSADSSRMQLNDLTTIPNLETLSANRQNQENPYLSISESNI